MLGYIQYVLVNSVRELGGEEALVAVAQKAGLKALPSFRIDTDYDNAQCLALIKATGEHFGLDDKALYALYADCFIKASRQQFPLFYDMAESAYDFLRRQPRIHQTLASSVVDHSTKKAVASKFELLEEQGRFWVNYRSDNALCGLYEALFYRLLEEYGETGRLEHRRCVHRGDELCQFELFFDGKRT